MRTSSFQSALQSASSSAMARPWSLGRRLPAAEAPLLLTAKRVNNDATETDQWNPAVAFLPDGPTLFIGYYSRQGRPDDNDLIMAYGAKADVRRGVQNATFDMIPISPEAFEPLFPGTLQSTPPEDWWKYDHVWTQGDVCLDINARYVGAAPGAPTCDQPGSYRETAFIYQHFNADDYTWAAADAPHFFYAWCDRSDSYVTSQGSRPDANVRLARIAP